MIGLFIIGKKKEMEEVIMPFKSQRQWKFFFSPGGRRAGIPLRKAREWAHETPNIKALPERVRVKVKLRKGIFKKRRK